MDKKQKDIIIIRSNSKNNDLLSCFSAKIKETRVTGFLGYLLSLNNLALIKALGIKHKILEIRLEFKNIDLLIITEKDVYVIEVKINYNDPLLQLKKYLREIKSFKEFRNKRLVPIALTMNNKIGIRNGIKYISWDVLFKSMDSNPSKIDKQKFLEKELMNHMYNQGMIPMRSNFEVYARDLNDEPFLSCFLKGGIYFCKFEKGGKVERCSYFAPYFGQKVAYNYPGIHEGMSYVAKIQSIEFVKKGDIKNFRKLLYEHNKNFFKKNWLAKNILSVDNDTYVLKLGSPFNIFNPPIQKNRLVGGSGWLGKKYFTFEQLFEAWYSGKTK